MELTEARLEANRTNAQLSTGPRTDEGKAKSSQNAGKHFLTGANCLLPDENPQEFELFRLKLSLEYRTRSEVERMLVEDLAWSWWKLQRAIRLQKAHLENHADDTMGLMRYDRYENSARRAYHKALLALETQKKVAPARQPQMSNAGAALRSVLANLTPQPGREIPLNETNPLFADSELGRKLRKDLAAAIAAKLAARTHANDPIPAEPTAQEAVS